MTPPSTAGLEPPGPQQDRGTGESPQLDDSQWASIPNPSTPSSPKRSYSSQRKLLGRPQPGRRRAASDSTVPETSIARESEPGGFKIVITQHGEDQRPRTVDDLDTSRPPFLEVAIPSWRIGTPRFSIRGTPFIRGSSYAPTEDIRSSSVSVLNRPSQQGTASNVSRMPSPTPISEIQSPTDPTAHLSQQTSPHVPHPLRSTYMSAHMVIEPAMFDALTFKPACDDRSIVRYSSGTGAVTAATPPRLVAEITSPSFLDYELLSDFFLTFRSFLDPFDLLRMLFARLRWAIARSDEAGMVVRVRTFVALRHWILNYFMDDFVVDYNLRVAFCSLLNDFVQEVADDMKARKVQLKILAELKKCWRRVCSQYWDGPDFDASLGPAIPITPGGIAGHRDPNLDPSFWMRLDVGPPQLDGLVVSTTPRGQTSFYVDVARAGHIDSVVIGDRPGTPENRSEVDSERNQASPTSIASVDVVSCSFPTKNTRFTTTAANHPLAAHPVDPSSVYNNSDAVATTPRALMGKRVRPHHTHKRNGSLSDSLREHASMTEKVLYKNAEFLLTLPYAGSLVRGNLLPPSQAFVEVLPMNSDRANARQTTLFRSPTPEIPKEKVMASAMSSQGMKRLLGSVRRALSTRGQSVPPAHGNFINISPIGPKGATTNRLPGTAIVPQSRSHQNGTRPHIRIDLLGAEIAEDFKKAVREDAAAEAEKNEYLIPPSEGHKLPEEDPKYSAAHMDTSFDFMGDMNVRPTSDTGITTGSKSIVIIDDTVLPGEYPVMTGALPVVNSNSSVEAFAETFMPNRADPTPPTTPPGRPPMGTPRRSSYVLSQQVLRPSHSADPLPPFVPDMNTLGPSVRASEDSARPSIDFIVQDPNKPPPSRVKGHIRQGSSRSYLSNRSARHQRYASFTSGIAPQPTIRSFDATTYSGESMDDSSQVLVPQPLRVLRRRPGGDLRAATNVGDLDPTIIRRSRSVGSLTTYTDSFGSSYLQSPVQDSSGFVDVATSDYSQHRGEETFSLGAIAEQNPKQKQLSLFSTHSSKPIMRPSFEAEAQMLAQIPDDLDDDGGVESALLKLEGKYEKKAAKISVVGPLKIDLPAEAGEVSPDAKKDYRHVHIGEEEVSPTSPTLPAAGNLEGSFLSVTGRHVRNPEVQSFLSEDSKASYTSIPLLEREFTDDGRSKRTDTQEWTERSVLQESDEGQSAANSQHPSYDFIMKTASMEKIDGVEPTAASSNHSAEQQSFLNVESDHDTDLSSEMSADELDAEGADDAVFALPTNPLGESSSPHLDGSPPSPPITLIQALQMSPESVKSTALQHQNHGKPLPPTPDTTPTTAAAPYTQYPASSSTDPTGTKEALRNAPKLEIPDPMPHIDSAQSTPSRLSAHLPFILAFDSDILAQQFTLIEKDALNEIDWKELIDMRWKNAEQNGINSRSWVSFLRDTDARGVEVVIARFNIMVKWAISEIVLTRDLEERARCIIKFIHIAAHCRRYRNFATMSQLTIALTSNEISRLSKTWAMVPASDKRTMQDLENLMSPTRNFYNLRAEMEGGGGSVSISSSSGGTTSTEMGCIPFVGIYTHDLLFNAQRPSEIASSPTTAPLVNFERCRISAGVVKTLLRLLEASSLYTFQPVEGITERCLWMGALTDEEIRRLGESLE